MMVSAPPAQPADGEFCVNLIQELVNGNDRTVVYFHFLVLIFPLVHITELWHIILRYCVQSQRGKGNDRFFYAYIWSVT